MPTKLIDRAGALGLHISRLFAYQLKGIREGGRIAVSRKIATVAGMSLALLPVLFVRLVRPIVLIRFRRLAGERIGHVAPDVELYLCERDSGQQPKAWDFFCYESIICNAQLGKMISRWIRVSRTVYYLDRMNRMIPGWQKHTITINGDRSDDEFGILAKWPIHLNLDPDEVKKSSHELEAIGIPDGHPYVCFHIRDSTFMGRTFLRSDSAYHNYRASSIDNYLQAVDELTESGFLVIRMGSEVENPLETGNPMVIDYAVNHRTDFRDICLMSNCQFFLGSSAGIWAIPAIFRKPIAYVNFAPVQNRNTVGPDDLLIPKKLWSREVDRFLTFEEIYSDEIGRIQRAETYQAMGIDNVENTPEEISDVVTEMISRLRGEWVPAEEDFGLQTRYLSIFRPVSEFTTRIGAKFLRQNQNLLATAADGSYFRPSNQTIADMTQRPLVSPMTEN